MQSGILAHLYKFCQEVLRYLVVIFHYVSSVIFVLTFATFIRTRWVIVSILLVGPWEIFYSTVFLFVFDMDQTPESTKLNQLRRVLELSNRTTPAERNSDVEWKTPSKGGYPENSPRSHAMKLLKSEQALLTSLSKFC